MPRPSDPIPSAYKPWLIASLAVLLLSLALLTASVGAAFVFFGRQTTPLWDVVLGILSALGVTAGFGGFFLLMASAAWQAWRASRKIQIIPPAAGRPPRDSPVP